MRPGTIVVCLLYILVGLTIVTTGAQAQGQSQPAAASPATTKDYDGLIAKQFDENAFQAFLKKLPKVTRSGRDGVVRTLYVIEGDVLATEQQVRAHIDELRVRGGQPARQQPSGELIVMAKNGRPVFWPKESRKLTYAVHRASFPAEGNYELVVANMAQATSAWVDACPECGVSFQHRREFDEVDGIPEDVTFVVAFVPNETSFIAAAFFPNDPLHMRSVAIGPQYFTTQFDRVGILRHEIGHILGYRHMHIVGVPGCNTEDNDWVAVSTEYDCLSVMHYMCGGGGTRELQLSDTDKRDHRVLYR